MSVLFKAIGRGQPGVVGGGELKYYPKIVREQNVEFKRFIKQIAELNTVNTADVHAVIDSMIQLLTRHLTQGRIVELGDLGHFSLNLKTQGEDSPQEVDKNSIRGTKIIFRPSKDLTKSMQEITFRKVDNRELFTPPQAA